MKVIKSKNAGYCMGVKRAFNNSFDITKKHKKICVFGEMVHNRFALKSITEKGIIIENDLDKIIKNNDIENVIIRAHGIPPYQEETLLKNNKKVFDFTCPIVKQVQLLAKKLSDTGYTVIITGKETHPEVIGITGYCKKNHYVVKSLEEAKKLPLDAIKRIALISQTTMNSNVFFEILEYFKSKRKDLVYHNTLCNLPVKIQENALTLAKKVDLMVIVGDKLSANTTTLYDKLKLVKKSIFVETVNDLDKNELKKFKKIGITGGSSTPDWQMDEIKNWIENL
ncbi:MAG: 4-hydroxy-3-methylbut-2-enyl diphosphate reductase [Spirochaetes bacterium]|nr:4-hydroxy-3-methylbut-2-enyl diphosphate reductase [Spirochaetota bacterium]